ncbi:MAG TPA: hypothetical protein VFT74_01290 [Isosphaeraceae bacterium]|nr:hypothetical protein [Isosphaeraceae bacterium]
MRYIPLCLLVVVLGGSMALADDATELAETLTKQGAVDFSARDARALAESYTDDGTVAVVVHDQSTGGAKEIEKQGRREIQELYEEMFRDGLTIDAHNEVDYARKIGSDFLMIAGTFEIKRGLLEVTRMPFVQVRIKQGDRWLIQSMRVVFEPKS